MLRTRVITAVCLAAVFFGALFLLPPLGWLVFSTLITVLAFWEWGGLMALRPVARWLLAAAAVGLVGIITIAFPSALGLSDGSPDAWQLGRYLYIPAACFWLLVVPMWLRWRWPLRSPVLGIFTGVLVILPAWLAFIQLRQIGVGHLLAAMVLVWLADIAAYFSGRAFGRHKLAPNISPGKTWEGALGAGVAVMIVGLLCAAWLPEGLAGQLGLLAVLLAALTAVSVIGDLFESMLKRQAGLKDSSNLLPGHGGVLDRIDSLTSTLPLVALILFGLGA